MVTGERGSKLSASAFCGEVIDIDHHYYEPRDVFSRHIDPAFRELAITPQETPEGSVWMMGDTPCLSFTVPGVPVDFVPPPGATAGVFSGEAESNANALVGSDGGGGLERREEHPEWFKRDARLKLMDQQGLRAIMILPSVGVIVDHDFAFNPPALCANYRGFNRWLEEEWGYASDGRIFTAPLLTLLDVDWAVEELERTAELGARFFWISHHPVNGKSPADPVFDRVWAKAQELGMKLIFHIGFEGFTYLYGSLWGEDPHRSLPQWSPFQHYIGHGTRAITDTFAALILHNLFGRFPGLEAITIENGSEWVLNLMKQMDKAAKMGRSGEMLGGTLPDLPSEIFKRHVYVNPFFEENVSDLVAAMGSDRVLFGSDWPHPEGLADPLSGVDRVAKQLSDDDLKKFVRDNGAKLLGLS